jgi:sec-independent protein translocase protein TatC
MAEHISNKKKAYVNPEKEMTFWEHLEELRWHLLRSASVLLVLAIIAFINRHFIFDTIILAPKDSQFITYRLLCQLSEVLGVDSLCLDIKSLEIINIQLSGQFMVHLYISIMAAIIAAFPYILWEIWSFIRPALRSKEKKYSRGAVVAGTILFFMGVMFSYFLIVPLTINFFGDYQVSQDVENSITLSSYISTVVSLTLACGFVFELPILIYFLTKVGIVTPSFLKRNRKYTLIILLTISAIITPPDIFSQVLVCLPLLLLYEFSIFVSKRVHRNIAEKETEEELAG